MSDDKDLYTNIAIAGPNEEKAKESDADSDESDDETVANASHLPRRLLESEVQITTRQKVINVKKNVDASKKNNSSESSSTEGEGTEAVPPRKRSKLQTKKKSKKPVKQKRIWATGEHMPEPEMSPLAIAKDNVAWENLRKTLHTPMNTFAAVVTADIFQLIADQTYLYAQQKGHSFAEVTMDEIKTFPRASPG